MTTPTEALRARLGHESAMQAHCGDEHLSRLLDEAALALAQQASWPDALRTRVQSALADLACARLREWAAIGPVQLAAVETLADLVAQQDGVQSPDLLAVAIGRVTHTYAESRPDDMTDWASRDPECPACRVIMAAESAQRGRVQIAAWAMQLPGCDGSADWVEIGPKKPEPLGDFVPRALVWADELAGHDKAAKWCAIHQHYKPCEHTRDTAATASVAGRPPECDSPKLCAVNGACAGQYGTKKQCGAAAPVAPVASTQHTEAVDHAHELLRRLGYHRDGDHFINVNRAGAEAMHVSTIATIVHAALIVASATPPAPSAPTVQPLTEEAMKWRKAVQEAYGWLWHTNNEPMAPVPMWSPEQAAYQARKCLRELLTTSERGEAINAIAAHMAKMAGITAAPTKE